MTNEQIIATLKTGETVTFGLNGRNMDVVDFMANLELTGFITTEDCSTSQESRRSAKWVEQGPEQ